MVIRMIMGILWRIHLQQLSQHLHICLEKQLWILIGSHAMMTAVISVIDSEIKENWQIKYQNILD